MSFLFSGGLFIPDSQLLWEINTGSGSTVIDTNGANDGTISGGTWVSGSNFYDGHAIDFDGDADYIDADPLTYVTQSTDWTIALQVDIDNLTSASEMVAHTINDDALVFGLNGNGLHAWLYDYAASSIVTTVGDISISANTSIGVILVCSSGSLSLHTESQSVSSTASETKGRSFSADNHRLGWVDSQSVGLDGQIGVYQTDNSAWDSSKRQAFFDILP